MRFLLFTTFFFNACTNKTAKLLSRKPNTDSLQEKSNVLNIIKTDEIYNHQDPLIWFGVIILIVLLSTIIPLIFKK